MNKPFALLLVVVASTTVACAASVDDEERRSANELTDENVATSEDALSRSGGGGRYGFTCDNGVCVCNKLVPNDCQDMRQKCIITSLFQLDDCLKSILPVCTCSMAVRVSASTETSAGSGQGSGVFSP